jgi:hypothetical protein
MMTQQPHEKQGAGTPRRVTGPMIAFRCPNGHVGGVPAHLAGKRARCPQCKTPMTIPVPAGSPAAANPLADNPLDGNPLDGNPLDDNPLAANPFDDNPLAADPLEANPLDALTVAAGPAPDDLPLLEPEPVGGPALPMQPETTAPLAEAGDAPWHPTADLVARLWAEREHGGHIEVHHADGVIVPDWYDVAWSRGTHGVFGSQAPDGTMTITAVAWSSVQQVIVRQVQTLPADMFPTG